MQVRTSTKVDGEQQKKAPRRKSRRLPLNIPEEIFLSIEEIAAEKAYRTPSELVQQGIRLILLAYKHETDPDHGLFWRNGEDYSKVLLV